MAAILLLKIYSNKMKPAYDRVICTPVFIAAQCTISRMWNQPRFPSTDDCIKKMWHKHTPQTTHQP